MMEVLALNMPTTPLTKLKQTPLIEIGSGIVNVILEKKIFA